MAKPTGKSRVAKLARGVKLIAFDVDGVLTDSYIAYDTQGRETLRFHAHDDVGIKYLLRAGLDCAFVSGRNSRAVRFQARELGVHHLVLGAKFKAPAVEKLLGKLRLGFDQLCFVGDDLADLPVIRLAAMGVAVKNARPELKREADLVTKSAGGSGAAREVVEIVLKAQRLWNSIMERYRA